MNSSSSQAQAPKAKKALTPLVAPSASASAAAAASAGTNNTNNTNKRVHEEEDSEKGDLCRSDEEDESDESSENSDDRAFIATDDEDEQEEVAVAGKIAGPGGADDSEHNLLARLVAMDDDEIIAYWTSEWQKLHAWLEADEKGRKGVYRLQAATLKMSEIELGNKRERILDARERLEAKARATPSVPAQPKPAENVKDTDKSRGGDESEEAKAKARERARARAMAKAQEKATEKATATATAQPPAAKMDAAPKKIKLSSSAPAPVSAPAPAPVSAPAPAPASVIPPPAAAPVREKKQGETKPQPRAKNHDREQT
jgi:hypothetical protein